ncbi:MAG: DoxX family protein [Solirubrobacteraceae bacterium]
MRQLGLTTLRIVVGGLFVGHGLQKLKGWFNGHGLEATGESFESMGLHPGKAHATAAGLAETVGGGLLCAGFLTPLGASMVSGSMAVAIHKIHGKNGVWVSEGGFEYNLVLATAAFALAAEGPGAMSLDGRLGTKARGLPVALAELSAALVGAAIVVKRPQLGRSKSAPYGSNGSTPADRPQPAVVSAS